MIGVTTVQVDWRGLWECVLDNQDTPVSRHNVSPRTRFQSGKITKFVGSKFHLTGDTRIFYRIQQVCREVKHFYRNMHSVKKLPTLKHGCACCGQTVASSKLCGDSKISMNIPSTKLIAAQVCNYIALRISS